MSQGRYSIELCNEGGPDFGIEAELARAETLTGARTFYRLKIAQYPRRVIVLCDRARILARSDRPDTMP